MTNLEQSIINRLNTIDDIAEETELAVLESMADAYGKALVLMEHCQDSEVLAKYPLFQESVFFQEADEAEQSEQSGNDQANKPKTAADIKLWNNKDSAVKNIALIGLRLLAKIVLIIKEAIVPSVSNIEKNAEAAINAAGNAGEGSGSIEQIVNNTTGEGDTPKKKAHSAGTKVLAGILVAGGISAGIAAKIFYDKYQEKNEQLETILADQTKSKEEKIEEVSEIVAQMAEAKKNFTYIIITANAQQPVSSLLNLQGIINVNKAIMDGFKEYADSSKNTYGAGGKGQTKTTANKLLTMMKTGDKEGIESFISNNFYSADGTAKSYTADQFNEFLNKLKESVGRSDTGLQAAIEKVEAQAKSTTDDKKREQQLGEIDQMSRSLSLYIGELRGVINSINSDVTMFNKIYSKNYGKDIWDEKNYGTKLPEGKDLNDILTNIDPKSMNVFLKELTRRFNASSDTKYSKATYDKDHNTIILLPKDGNEKQRRVIVPGTDSEADNLVFKTAVDTKVTKESVTEDVEDETITEAMRQKGVEIAAKDPNKILADAQAKFREAISKNDPEIARQTWKLLREAELGAANAEFGEKWYERIDEYRDRLKATFGTDTFASSSTTTEYATDTALYEEGVNLKKAAAVAATGAIIAGGAGGVKKALDKRPTAKSSYSYSQTLYDSDCSNIKIEHPLDDEYRMTWYVGGVLTDSGRNLTEQCIIGRRYHSKYTRRDNGIYSITWDDYFGKLFRDELKKLKRGDKVVVTYRLMEHPENEPYNYTISPEYERIAVIVEIGSKTLNWCYDTHNETYEELKESFDKNVMGYIQDFKEDVGNNDSIYEKESADVKQEYATEEDFFDDSTSDDMFEEGAFSDYLKKQRMERKEKKESEMTPEELAKKQASAEKRKELKNKAIEGAESVGKKLLKLPVSNAVASAVRKSNEQFSAYKVKPFSARVEEDPDNPDGLLVKVDIKLPTTAFPSRISFYRGMKKERREIEEAIKRDSGKRDSKVVFSYEPAEIKKLIDEG